MIDIKNNGDNGIAYSNGQAVLSYSIAGADQISQMNELKNSFNNYAVIGDRLRLQNYTVATHGHTNLLPNEVIHYIKHNPLLPELIKKQVRIMYGQGFGLYKVDDTGDKPVKKWVSSSYAEVINWLLEWEKNGLDPFAHYLKRIIHEYYFMEGYYNAWEFNKSRRIGGSLPIKGLRALNGLQCRLATTSEIDIRARILDKDCDRVLVSDWKHSFYYDIEDYPRFNPANPFASPFAVNYVRDRGFNEDIYANPTFYVGLKPWIEGANLNPRYINSYLKNSFNAKLHAIIPDSWIKQIETALRSICDANARRKDENKPLQTEYEGVKNIGCDFNEGMVVEAVNNKIRECVNVMSGTGENQGKMFWSRSFLTENGLEKWEFVDIPTKYKEFVESIISFNKTSTQMILAGKGVDPAISNIGNEGVFNSGAQVYYSYLVYLDTLTYPEEYILEDINRVLWLNFPRLAKDGVKLGFMRYAPEKQQDTAPDARMNNPQISK